MKKISVLTLFVLFSLFAQSQTAQKAVETRNKKGIAYIAIGSHRTFYSPGDITFKRKGGPAFNFTLENAKAKDEGGLKFHTGPQFSYTIGYYFKNKNLGLEYQYDHIKYYLKQNQVVRLTGTINGVIYDKDTLLTPQFVKLEHSDGGNYAMVNFVKWIPIAANKKKENVLTLIAKCGIGVVNPKTNTTILGKHRDDKYHISGYVIGVESGLRYNFSKHFFATTSFKGAFANYGHFLISNGYGHQRWFSGQFIYLVGGQFPL